jgi:hypothetical protein
MTFTHVGADAVPGVLYEKRIRDVLRSLGRPRRMGEDNIEMDLREIGIDGRTGLSWIRIGSNDGLV